MALFYLDGLAAGRTLLEQFRTAVFALGANGIEHGASPSRFRFLNGFYQVMSRESSFIFSALPFSDKRRFLQGLSGLCFFQIRRVFRPEIYFPGP